MAKNPATVVSAYYRMPSKRPHEFYVPHIRRFLETIRAPLVFYTSADLLEELRSYRTINRETTRFEVLEIEDFNAFKRHGRTFWEQQCQLDTEKYHTPEVAAVWYEKKEFVLRTAALNPFRTELFMWCDSGLIRTPDWMPHMATFCTDLKVVPKGRLLVPQIREMPKPRPGELPLFKFPAIMIAAGLMVGHAATWQRLADEYEKVLQAYVKAGYCVNSDQYIIASLGLTKPDLIQFVDLRKHSTCLLAENAGGTLRLVGRAPSHGNIKPNQRLVYAWTGHPLPAGQTALVPDEWMFFLWYLS